jgi:hypothetical protein
MSPEFFVAFIALLGHFFYYLQFAKTAEKKLFFSMKFKRECEMKEEIEVKRMITRRTQLRKMLLFFVRNNRRKKKGSQQ